MILIHLGLPLWTGFTWLGMRAVAGSCGHTNELSISVKGDEILLASREEFKPA
jgi:hypothetical protein